MGSGISSIACFAASPLIVNIDLLLETIPKVDAKLEAEKNNTAIDIAGKVGFERVDIINLSVIIRDKAIKQTIIIVSLCINLSAIIHNNIK
jgi:hypothetical protein